MRVAIALLAVCAANGQSFDVASVKPAAAASGISCTGGPGTSSPGMWRCSSMPLGYAIWMAYGFQSFQFSPRDPCCTPRFDFDVRIPNGTAKDQFDRMLQNLLRERFKLAFHYERKEVPIYELSMGSVGPKMKPASPGVPTPPDESWTQGVDKDGYPTWPAGVSRLSGSSGHFRWTTFNLSTPDIAKTLSEQSGRLVVDATGLKGEYDVDLKWVVDFYSLMSEMAKAELEEQVGRPLESPSGPTLVRAVQDQLGLKMSSKKGSGEVVVIDHVEKVPIEN